MTPPHLTSRLLEADGLKHGFFGRAGGVSRGMFSSLNVGFSSTDSTEDVEENRRRCREALSAEHLLTLLQIHSPNAVIVTEPWLGAGPRADGIATRMRGVAIGVLAADCMPFLFADVKAGVIGAAHAGWRGALSGILEATIEAMVSIGAREGRIVASVGPCLRPPNFEVGGDVLAAFTRKYQDSEQFFAAGAASDKRQFDLVGFGRSRLFHAGVENLDDIGVCTLGESGAYFSYRGSRRAGDTDYGRNLSAIVMTA